MRISNKITLVFLFISVVSLIIFGAGQYAHSANGTPTPSPTVDICVNHGGVNCTVLNPEASVVCNDGTIDEFPTIYAVPQCQQKIQEISKQQSDFMAQSGCFPPGEMACINQQSYKNLTKHLTDSGLINSDLGKDELVQCNQQISDYQRKNDEYQQCLIKNNNPNFSPIGKTTEPIMKAIFCPIFYGDKASYDPALDLCICDAGYFMSNETCTSASLICQSKYGPSASAKNGNCSVPRAQSSVGPTPQPTTSINEAPIESDLPTTNVGWSQPTPSPIATGGSSNFFVRIFNMVVSGIKNILKL